MVSKESLYILTQHVCVERQSLFTSGVDIDTYRILLRNETSKDVKRPAFVFAGLYRALLRIGLFCVKRPAKL